MVAEHVRWAIEDPVEQTTGECVILAFPQQLRHAPDPAPLDAEQRRKLDMLRRLARNSALAARPCRLAARKVFGCAASACEKFCAAEQFRAFLENAQTRLTLYRPGAEAVSFDERWLLRLIDALDRGDVPEASGLVAFRVAHPNRRAALEAASSVSLCLDPFAAGRSSAI